MPLSPPRGNSQILPLTAVESTRKLGVVGCKKIHTQERGMGHTRTTIISARVNEIAVVEFECFTFVKHGTRSATASLAGTAGICDACIFGFDAGVQTVISSGTFIVQGVVGGWGLIFREGAVRGQGFFVIVSGRPHIAELPLASSYCGLGRLPTIIARERTTSATIVRSKHSCMTPSVYSTLTDPSLHRPFQGLGQGSGEALQTGLTSAATSFRLDILLVRQNRLHPLLNGSRTMRSQHSDKAGFQMLVCNKRCGSLMRALRMMDGGRKSDLFCCCLVEGYKDRDRY
ncbi:hypothetical protein BKA70DRAFT_1215049 [Coprinopsis sp. MPI-PUGE-AT-0042]|nr:hypothetical protein BKA70DRAFT_1215049 [Coprinopsis sp. MPI-PUGE-AT-0042]